MDPNYAGIRGVINAWGPLLAKTDNAALTGYFMNWVAFAEKGSVTTAGPSVLRSTVKLLMESNRVCYQVLHVIGAIVTEPSPRFSPWQLGTRCWLRISL